MVYSKVYPKRPHAMDLCSSCLPQVHSRFEHKGTLGNEGACSHDDCICECFS